jgi:site-specific recombinase XerD
MPATPLTLVPPGGLQAREPPAPRDLPDPLEAFARHLGGRDPKTVAAYLTVLRDLVDWLAQRPGGGPFRMERLTATAVRGYLEHLQTAGRAPRTRSKALSVLRRFGRWAVDEGLLRRNPAAGVERPTVVALAPTELSADQRYVLGVLLERVDSRRLDAVVALAYWAGLRISEVATLRVGDCAVNQRAGALTLVEAKGGKTRAIDLPNAARRALYAYLFENAAAADARDPDSAYVFTSQRAAWLRQQGRPDHLSTRGIEHLWGGLKARATHEEWALLRDVTFHDLRHDWAHRARAAGWLLEEIAVYAGHQTKDGAPAIATTARYTLPSRQQLKARLQALRG